MNQSQTRKILPYLKKNFLGESTDTEEPPSPGIPGPPTNPVLTYLTIVCYVVFF